MKPEQEPQPRARVLYIEDSPQVAFATRYRLTSNGYEVVHVLSGEEALHAVLDPRGFDLALVDVNLGEGLDGAQTARVLLEYRDLPIIFLSAYSDQSFVEKVEGIPNYGYVLKSPGEFALLQTLQSALRLRREQRLNAELLEQAKAAAKQQRLLDQASSDRLNLIMTVARLAWWETDLDSGQVVFSPNKATMLGRNPAEFQSYMDFVNLLHPTDKSRALLKMRDLIEGRSPTYDVEYRILAADGQYLWFRDIGGLRPDVGTRVVSGIVIDITAQKLTEAALIESARLGVVAEVAAAVAHDFNNSLQAISGHLQLVSLDASLSQPTGHRLQVLASLVTDASKRIRPLQHHNAGGQGYESQSLDLNQLVRDSVEQTRPFWKVKAEAAEATVEVNLVLQATTPVRADAADLRHVLFNLIKNAVEAMPTGGSLTLTTRDGPGHVALRITDTGLGMDEATRERLFQPFFSTKGTMPGRGLGMSSSLTLVKRHKGHLSVVDSRIGKGTTVELTLPSADVAAPPPDKPAELGPHLRLKVLWVDDEPDIRSSGCEILDLLGHHATPAASGTEALALCEHEDFDLVLTDLGMPLMSGWQLVAELARRGVRSKVVVLTGWADYPADDHPDRPQVYEVLAKPLELNRLKELLRRVSLEVHRPPTP
jgi:PAS domain S-box-containing protein